MKTFLQRQPPFRAAILVLVLLCFVMAPLVYAFNPQPEPPAQDKSTPAVQTPHDIKALGPQPEPPDKPDIDKLSPQPGLPDKSDLNKLGPQPEPPDRERQER